jgi:hypothetical protein
MPFFYKNKTGRQNRSCLGGGTSEREEDIRKEGQRVIWYKYSVLMFVNGKTRPVETIPGIGGGEIKENDGGVNSSMIYSKKFCKYHNVLLVQQSPK